MVFLTEREHFVYISVQVLLLVLCKVLLLGIVYHIRSFHCLVAQLEFFVLVFQSFDVSKSTTETTVVSTFLTTGSFSEWFVLLSNIQVESVPKVNTCV